MSRLTPQALQGKIILVTGVNSGVGLALLQGLSSAGATVVGTVRAHALAAIRDMGFSDSDRLAIKVLEITDYLQSERVIEDVQAHFGPIDVLINNAGVSYRTVVEQMDPSSEEHQIHVNYLGPLHLIRLVLPKMRERRSGRIINISSVSGMMAMPTMASYSASKFALEGASEALWYEVKPWNIHVSLIQPGFIRSKSFRHVLTSPAASEALTEVTNPYHQYYKFMTSFIERLMDRSPATPEKIAAKILSIITANHPPLRVPVTPDAIFFSWLRRLVPRRIYHCLLYRSLPHIRQWGKNQKT